MTYYNWIYTTSNENSYILFLIIVILGVIILNFNLLKKKTDRFNDITNNTTPQRTANLHLTEEEVIERRKQLLDISNSNPYNISHNATDFNINNDINNNDINNNNLYYIPPNATEFNIDNKPTFIHVTEPQLYLTRDQINPNSLSYGISKLDGDQESIDTSISTQNGNNGNNGFNDIMQSNSSLYTSILTGKSSFQSSNYASIGNYATLNSVGSTMTDTLGGIKSSLGYAILDDQLGTFTPIQQNNPYAYDNTATYQTGMNPDTVDGSNYKCNGYGNSSSGSPIFLQKDFTGVANIFAPNIIIANPPLTSDGLPDISFKM
jgi:hypothetical protein